MFFNCITLLLQSQIDKYFLLPPQVLLFKKKLDEKNSLKLKSKQ